MVLAITHHNGLRIAELAYAFGAVAGVAFVLGGLAGKRIWSFVGGVALAIASVLLIVAAHWGHYG